MKKIIFPLIVVAIILVLVGISNKKESASNVLISYEDETTTNNVGYVEGVYESVVKPNYEVDSNNGNKVLKTNSESFEFTDEEILITDSDGNLVVEKLSDLLEGNKPTNSNKTFTVAELEKLDKDKCKLIVAGFTRQYVSLDMCYDTELVERTIGDSTSYIGVLYGKYLYSISNKYVEMFNIDKYMVIASHSDYVTLGYDEEIHKPISLFRGHIQYTEEP